jgi:hypothetical protein
MVKIPQAIEIPDDLKESPSRSAVEEDSIP